VKLNIIIHINATDVFNHPVAHITVPEIQERKRNSDFQSITEILGQMQHTKRK
jgi:hypothetical protein